MIKLILVGAAIILVLASAAWLLDGLEETETLSEALILFVVAMVWIALAVAALGALILF